MRHQSRKFYSEAQTEKQNIETKQKRTNNQKQTTKTKTTTKKTYC